MATAASSLPSRELVLDAAQQLLLKHGYAGLSMRELAQHSGLAKSTIYHHFHDKRDIYLHVLERDIRVVRDRLQAAAMGPGDAPARLRALIQTYFTLQQERRLLIMQALRDAAGLEAQLHALIRRYRAELLHPFRLVLVEAIDAGLMRPVDVEFAALSLLGMLHAFVTHRMLLDDRPLEDDVVDHILDLLLHGLLVPSAPVSNTQPV
jgi:AcrR family transcriptional regulator